MEASALIKEEDGVETANMCRWCLLPSDALEALANDDSRQYKVQKICDFTGLQIELSPGVPSYLCTMCEARLKKMSLIRWRCNRNNDLVDKCIEQQNTAKNDSEFSQDHLDHSAEQTVGTELSIKTEVFSPDAAKDLHLNKKCFTVHQANMTYECCGKIPDDLFEAEENPIAIKSEYEEVEEQHQLQTTNDFLDIEQDNQKTNPLESIRIKTEVSSPDAAKDLHLNKKCFTVHQANMTYECCGKIPDDLFEAEENPIAIKSEYEEVEEQHQLQTTNDFLDIEQDNQKTNPLKSICQVRKDHPVTVADNTCADDSAAESIQNVLSPGTRNAHSKSHSINHKHHCPHCSATYPFLSRLKIHIRTHTGERPYQCKGCDKAFHSSGILAIHSKLHNKDQQHQCHHCSSMFAQLSKLMIHIRTHTGEKPYQCKVCDKAFYSSGSLAVHSKIHNKDQQHQCHHCSSMFAQFSQLEIHIRTHTSERPYQCKGCDKAFRSSASLVIHSKIHNKDQQQQCPHCSSKFTQSSHLKSHIRIHTGEKPYKCKVCDKAYRLQNSLAYHYKTHKNRETH